MWKGNYEKILVCQYGKVGSSTLKYTKGHKNGGYFRRPQETYNEFVIQTHSVLLAKDILSKYKNVLIINIVRLPIDQIISWFFEHYRTVYNNNYDIPISKLIKDFEKKKMSKKDPGNRIAFMENFLNIFNINTNNFKFDKEKKYSEFTHNGNDVLLFRFEDWEYIKKNVLPKYDINITKKYNVKSGERLELYEKFKKEYKMNDIIKNKILSDKFLHIFYSKKEIEEHLKKYS